MTDSDIISDLFARHRLDEVSVRDLSKAIHPSRLPHRDYLRFLRSVNYQGMRDNTLKVNVLSPRIRYPRHPGDTAEIITKPRVIVNVWKNYFQFADWWTVLRDTTIKPMEGARLLLSTGNIKVHCNCPAYKFWGYQYILTQLDAAIMPEERFPHKRNPQLLNCACKHLRKSIPCMLFYSGILANQISRQRERKGIK